MQRSGIYFMKEEENILEYQKIIGEKILQLGIFDFGNMELFISESGKFYDQYGFIAKNTEDLWKYIFEGEFPDYIVFYNFFKTIKMKLI